MECIKNLCLERFSKIEFILEDKNNQISKQQIDLQILKSDFNHLTKSLNSLTKALWGIAGTVLTTVVTLVITSLIK